MTTHAASEKEHNPLAFQQGRQQSWRLADIPFDSIDIEAVRNDTYLFYLLAAASFVEITSDLYTNNLVDYFDGDEPLQNWLLHQWEREEMQHGAALKRYVLTVWPEFDWELAYAGFYAEYSRLCVEENLGPTRGLELVARCVVETGTATLYTLLQRLSPEPVLRDLTGKIRADEVRHYKYFYHYFLEYRSQERPRRLAVLRSLWHRVGEIDDEDSYIAFKYVYCTRHPERADFETEYRVYRQRFLALARSYYPVDMAVKMFLKPLQLNPRLQKVTVPVLTAGTRYLILR